MTKVEDFRGVEQDYFAGWKMIRFLVVMVKVNSMVLYC